MRAAKAGLEFQKHAQFYGSDYFKQFDDEFKNSKRALEAADSEGKNSARAAGPIIRKLEELGSQLN